MQMPISKEIGSAVHMVSQDSKKYYGMISLACINNGEEREEKREVFIAFAKQAISIPSTEASFMGP